MLKVDELDIGTEKTLLREKWKELTGTYPLPSYPEDFILDLELYERLILINYINDRYLANFIDYAKGEDLDRLASNYGISRLPPLPAITVLRFYLTSPTLIPRGTRVSSTSGLVFKTIEERYGNDIVDVLAECEVAGTIGNGFQPGEIKILLDNLSGVEKVENKTITTGGCDEEDDDHLRKRIKLSLDKPTAGSREHYKYLIFSLRPDIVDVNVYRSAPGHVVVTFILKNGEVPTEDLVRKAIQVLTNEKNKPLTDLIEVIVPQVISIDIKLIAYVESPPPDISTIIKTRIQAYVNNLKTTIGEALYLTKLIDIAHAHPSVKTVQVVSPAEDIKIKEYQVINVQNITVEVKDVKSR